ncbi:MAG: BMC domain-containing protein [Deltaproteobacteria bacterium]|nr:BMC domain-containing protein [Deltaproteobacteria bacterium]
MNGKALGMIETVGLVPAVEAGDVALKTADVTLVGSQAVGGGLVSILITGDVSAVTAAIDAASAAAKRLGQVRSVTVIARSAEGLDGILIAGGTPPTCSPEPNGSDTVQPEITPDLVVETKSVVVPPAADQPEEPAPKGCEAQCEAVSELGDGEALSFDMEELKKLKVTKLRRLARQLPTFAIAVGEIKYARKKDLLEAFTQYMNTLEK